MLFKMIRRTRLPVLILVAILSFTACSQPPAAVPDSGVDLGDPEVGGGAGVETGPQTPIPAATATLEASPRLDAAARATAESRPPTPVPTAAPTIQLPTIEPAGEPVPEGEQSPEIEAPAETAEPEPSPTAEAPPNETGEIIHVVQPGENLYRIGLQYGVSWVAIAEYNGITDPDAISAGQELRIPPSE